MRWDGYTIFSVLSGIVLLIVGIVGIAARSISGKDRAYGLLTGAFLAGYGIYAAAQTSGAFIFPIWIFIIPPAAIAYFVFTMMSRKRGTVPPVAPAPPATIRPQAGNDGAGDDRRPASPPAAPGSAPAGNRPAPVERPSAWSPPPPPPGSSAAGA
jgi:hypothetical protein